MYKKASYTCKVVVLVIWTYICIAFLPFSRPSPSSLLKLSSMDISQTWSHWSWLLYFADHDPRKVPCFGMFSLPLQAACFQSHTVDAVIWLFSTHPLCSPSGLSHATLVMRKSWKGLFILLHCQSKRSVSALKCQFKKPCISSAKSDSASLDSI